MYLLAAHICVSCMHTLLTIKLLYKAYFVFFCQFPTQTFCCRPSYLVCVILVLQGEFHFLCGGVMRCRHVKQKSKQPTRFQTHPFDLTKTMALLLISIRPKNLQTSQNNSVNNLSVCLAPVKHRVIKVLDDERHDCPGTRLL